MRSLLALFITVCLFVQAAYIEGQSQGRNNQGAGITNNALSAMNKNTAAAAPDMTPQDAYYLGRAVAANILAAYKPYTQNAELTGYLNRICQSIVINSSQPESFNGYHVIILDSAEFNAFASPGGHIFITRKLVETATSEDMLAAVIAHELAHIMLRHSLAIINEMSFTNDAAAIAGRAIELSGNSANQLSFYRNAVSQIADTMMKNGYSQLQEFDADRAAAALLAETGYDPAALTEMLKILQQVQASSRGGFNTTHPGPAQRVANVNALRYHVEDTRRYRVPRFKNK